MKPTNQITLFLLLLFQVSLAMGPPDAIGEISFCKVEVVTENTTRIPFKLIDHLIVVEANVHKKTGNFIIDTGAEGFILNSVHFSPNNSRSNATIGNGVNGDINEVRESKVYNFGLKDFIIKNKNSQIIDLSHLEKSKNIQVLGIIGYEILKDYEVFIDFQLKQITLFKTDRHGNRIDKHILLEKITDSLDIKVKKHTIVLECFVNGEKLNFGLDTGAEINLLSKSVSKSVLKKFRIVKRVKMVGIHNKKIEVLAGKLYGVKLKDKLHCGVMRTIVTNLNKMQVAYGTKLDGVLGYDFFAMRRLIINYKKEKLYFVKPYS